MQINVNPDAQAGGFGYVEAGNYRLRVTAVELKESNFPYLKWTFELTDPNVKATDEKLKPGNIFDNTTLKEDGQFRLKGLWDALGLEWGAQIDPETAIGLEFEASLKVDEYQGTFSNKVKAYLAA